MSVQPFYSLFYSEVFLCLTSMVGGYRVSGIVEVLYVLYVRPRPRYKARFAAEQRENLNMYLYKGFIYAP